MVGCLTAGLFSLGCGLVHDKVGMFILRAINGGFLFEVVAGQNFILRHPLGISAALTVPSALALIVEWYV